MSRQAPHRQRCARCRKARPLKRVRIYTARRPGGFLAALCEECR
jgi:hypothetical protein